jgi:hypothetical protein
MSNSPESVVRERAGKIWQSRRKLMCNGSETFQTQAFAIKSGVQDELDGFATYSTPVSIP